jgi:hypothetical protein
MPPRPRLVTTGHRRGRGWWWLVVLELIVVGAAALAGWYALGNDENPAPSPSPSAPASPAASAAPTASPQATAPPVSSATPSPTPDLAAQRLQMIVAVEQLQAGIESWAADNGGMYPTQADVRQGYGVAVYVVPWPANPYAPEQALTPGLAIGEYEYQQLAGGAAYSLTGHLDNGAFVVP